MFIVKSQDQYLNLDEFYLRNKMDKNTVTIGDLKDTWSFFNSYRCRKTCL